MISTLTPDRLKLHLEGWLERNPSRPIFAVYHDGDWGGGNQLLVGDRRVDVRVCESELAMREVLAEYGHNGQGLVMLTAADRLGSDVLALLDRPRIHRLQTLDALMQLFDVRSVDPAVARERWLVDVLVDSAPPGGYERAGARELDKDRAWRALLGHRHGIELDAGLEGLLVWAMDPRREALLNAAQQERDAIAAYLPTVLPGCTGILAAVLVGAREDALALGLVARVLVDAPEETALVAARTRFEARLHGWGFDLQDAAAWASAAESRLVVMGADPRTATRALQLADQILEQLQATELARHSDYLDSGLRQRLSRLGIAIDQLLTGGGDGAVVASEVDWVRRHHGADEQTSTIALMALRLARWIGADTCAGDSLKAAGACYVNEYSYADWARTDLRHGAGEQSLDDALQRLAERADSAREEQERAFAQHLASWAAHAATDDSLLGVEHVLGRIVAPLARQAHVLVVVLDGMSHRVADELLADVVHSGWTELRRATHPKRALVVSVLPSVTALSRTSLLTGELQRGAAIDEKRSFAIHPGLVAASDGSGAPELFHKGDITEDGWLSKTLRSAVAGERRVVGVVVNAIDDHLARGEQLRNPWSVHDILPLRWLLDAARDAGRIVVLTSDHGHVLEHGSELRPSSGEGGERWRSGGDGQQDGEVAVQGTRVLAPGGTCVLAYSERVRYGPKKNGYHGGGSAQEVLTPLLVLAPALVDELEGWAEAAYDPPEWWFAESVAPREAPAEPVTAPAREVEPGEQMALSTEAARSATADWIGELLASELFAAQRAGAGRTPVSDERTAQILQALDQHGGRLLRDALSRACGIPVMRLTGTLAALRQVLNVDGYPVLTVDDATGDVKLDEAMLADQFGLTRV